MYYRLKADYLLHFGWGSTTKSATAPKGCEVRSALDLQEHEPHFYFIQPWPDMPEKARNWCNVYGFTVPAELVEIANGSWTRVDIDGLEADGELADLFDEMESCQEAAAERLNDDRCEGEDIQ